MKLFLPFLSAAFILSGCVQPKAALPTNAEPVILENNAQDASAVPDVQVIDQPHPVSLQAFAQKAFDGGDLTLGQVLDKNSAYTRYYITYRSGKLNISGIMNVPNGEGPFPVLILNHGHIDTNIYTNGRGLKREQDYLARRGYVVLHSDYRNHADSDTDDQNEYNFRFGYSEDVINALLAVRNSTLPYFDKENIGMLGHSMGGGVAQNIMVTQPGLVKAYVLFAPVSTDYADNFERWTKRNSDVAQEITRRYGTPTSSPEFWKNISPINFLQSVTEPVHIHHGTADESVPLEWSERTAQALKAAGKDVELFVYESEPHEFINAWPRVMQRVTEFFDQQLKR